MYSDITKLKTHSVNRASTLDWIPEAIFLSTHASQYRSYYYNSTLINSTVYINAHSIDSYGTELGCDTQLISQTISQSIHPSKSINLSNEKSMNQPTNKKGKESFTNQ